MCSKTPVQAPRINSGPTASGFTDCQASQLCPTFNVPSLVLCRYSYCHSRVSELSLAQVSGFCGCHCHGLDPFAHIMAPQSLRLFWKLSLVLHCRSLYLLPPVAGWMFYDYKVVIKLIIGEGLFRHPLHYCLGSYLESFLWIPENFPSAMFLTSLWIGSLSQDSSFLLGRMVHAFNPSTLETEAGGSL